MAAARELLIADEPAAWAALGFAAGEDGVFALGGLTVRLTGRAGEGGLREVRVAGLGCRAPRWAPRGGHGRRRAGGAGRAPQRRELKNSMLYAKK